MLEGLGALLVSMGILFFIAGTVGLLRFPDLYTRLHSLTKADNMGLGLVAMGLALQAETLREAAVLILIWLLILLTSAVGSYLLAHQAYAKGIQPWRKP